MSRRRKAKRPPIEEIPHDEDAPSPHDADGLEYTETPIDPEADEDGVQHVQIEIKKVLTGRRLDKYLSGRLGKSVSRSALQRYIKEGDVTVNRETVKPSYQIQPGDVIDMMLPESKPQEIPPEPIPLNVIYEDDDLIAINKQAGLIIHPARGNWSGTLVNGLAYYFRMNWRGTDREGNALPDGGQSFRPGIVHRLDRDTTGVILVAKSELALWRLGHQFEHREINKTYTTLVHGIVELDEDVIEMPIGKHPVIKERYVVDRRTGRPHPATTKDAVTRYRVLERIDNVGLQAARFTLVECYPKTGRTHQIRVHMSGLGHPIVADKLYGGAPVYVSQLEGRHDVAEGELITRQALHAHTIEFNHPRSGKRMTLEAPLPPDMAATLEEIRSRQTAK
jgi:23S rRNA pseudouridine1911/1915/1917 synthase